MSTQPRTAHLTFKALLSLPSRLCNPPPAVAKVRSCGVTPVFQVQLDDILERKHLPPLGLKDFEEWLLYCEDAVENLYFILWLKEYTVKYKQWVARATFERDNAREYRMDWPLQPSAHLAMFYLRAKQTFFTPNAAYELNLPSVTFAPFHASHGSPHPDPIAFTEVALQTRKMLDESLNRFVTAQFSNVGNQRVMCGIIAGTLFCLLAALTPLAHNFVHGQSRWLRLVAFPGLWLGLIVLLASLNGVCVGVYIFGDLRQLRKFELSRPAISKPQPLKVSRQRPMVPYPVPGITPIPSVQPRLSIVTPSPAHIHSPRSPTRMSQASSSSSRSRSSLSGDTGAIHISPAYYDADLVEGPAISPITPDLSTIPLPTKSPLDEQENGSFPATAPFIQSLDQPFEDDDHFGGPLRTLPEERQVLAAFDFDALPRRSYSASAQQLPVRMLSQSTRRSSVVAIEPEVRTPAKLRLSPKAIAARMQSRCTVLWAPPREMTAGEGPAGTQPEPAEDEKPPRSTHDSIDSASRPPLDLPHHTRRVRTVDKSAVERKFKMVRAVPAFAVPLTPILSSVVVRGQWEIVMRSAVYGFLICWVVLGSLLAIPPRR
ncbi:hypothetical protein MSAN_01848900 [Mycena sanguinolenta]|uniref:Uncharacterized protein n=1 Tax=Mycena sanguinolenta TaxID=230812 RepID=A0A8H6XTW4_9AGAR|nr:hypothetical protein MSAN_01848900 [Mycena sanguinolenta]